MWHKRDTMTQAHYVQSGNGHFNAGAQKKPDGFIRQAEGCWFS